MSDAARSIEMAFIDMCRQFGVSMVSMVAPPDLQPGELARAVCLYQDTTQARYLSETMRAYAHDIAHKPPRAPMSTHCLAKAEDVLAQAAESVIRLAQQKGVAIVGCMGHTVGHQWRMRPFVAIASEDRPMAETLAEASDQLMLALEMQDVAPWLNAQGWDARTQEQQRMS